jgi:hypothetical protein
MLLDNKNAVIYGVAGHIGGAVCPRLRPGRRQRLPCRPYVRERVALCTDDSMHQLAIRLESMGCSSCANGGELLFWTLAAHYCDVSSRCGERI